MYKIEYISSSNKVKRGKIADFLIGFNLKWEDSIEFSINILENDEIKATGSLDKNVIKCVAVSKESEGAGYAAILITELEKKALDDSISHLFLFTMPKNENLFNSLGYYMITKTDETIWMENKRDGIDKFVESVKRQEFKGKIGCVIANANPFTKGHLHLVEKACNNCDYVYLFIVSEENKEFKAWERLELAKRACKGIKNLNLSETGPYMVSFASFPTYFIADEDLAKEVNCKLDLKAFCEKIAKPLGITMRFVGEEPLSKVTEKYNEAMMEILPKEGIEVNIIPRKEAGDNVISATFVRKLYNEENWVELYKLVPASTYEYLKTERVKNA